MRITKYSTLIGDNMYPELFKEKSFNCEITSFMTPESIVSMMNHVFKVDKQTEEFLYELCFDTKMKLIGVFEISHGTANSAAADPRVVFMKALLCGASYIALLHNHPSGDVTPSMQDYEAKEKMEDAGNLIGISVIDNIIVGRNGRYFSFRGNS